MSGRIQLDPSLAQPFERVIDNGKQWTSFEADALKGQMTSTPVSELFFSKKNLDIVQDGIRYSVYRQSNGKYQISKQSEDELKIIMRSIFLQHAKNSPYDIVSQVRDLNGLVLEYCVKEIISHLELDERYKKDISTLPIPLSYGQNESVKGTKIAELTRF